MLSWNIKTLKSDNYEQFYFHIQMEVFGAYS